MIVEKPSFSKRLGRWGEHFWQRSPWLSRAGLALAAAGLLAVVFSLAAASGNNSVMINYYTPLLWVNIVLCVLLGVVVALLLLRLLWRIRQNKFGARITLQFALAFSVLSVVPGVIVYLTSVLFLQQSMDSWFNVRLTPALNTGIELSRYAIREQLQELSQKARTAANLAAQSAPLDLAALKLQFPSADLAILDERGKTLSNSGQLFTKGLMADSPSNPADWALLKKTGVLFVVESLAEPNATAQGDALALRAVVAIPSNSPIAVIESSLSALSGARRYLQLTQLVTPQVNQWSQTMSKAFSDYEALELGRSGLRKIYSLSLTMTLLLGVLAAMTAGFVVADRIAAPLLRLARGTQALAAGQFTPIKESGTRDDLAVLTRSFNSMSSQLSQARERLTDNKQYLEQLLENLSTGVLVLDSQRALVSLNVAGLHLLGLERAQLDGRALDQMLPDRLAALLLERPISVPWEAQFELSPSAGVVQRFLIRGTPVARSTGDQLLVVFDDISDVMVAQKALAWGEVARRLAHEIKNPLTPIQLSAERLQHKLSSKLTVLDAELLKRSTSTIVSQVGALKRMVDEFKEFARLPQAQLAPMRLNAFVQEVCDLYANNTQGLSLLVRCDAVQDACMGDKLQLRQVLNNLIGNAIDATRSQLASKQAAEAATAVITITTRDSSRGLALSVEDQGAGFSAQAMSHLFEPYQTTKAEGTGLGLAIVHRIVQDHQGRIQVKNLVVSGLVRGASVEIVLPRLGLEPPPSSPHLNPNT